MKAKVLFFLLAFIFFLFILGLNVEFQSQRSSYYTKKFAENNIEKITNKSSTELEIIAKDLRGYLLSGQETLLNKHFSSNEVSHMEDVFQLFFTMRVLMAISLGLFLGIFIPLYRKMGFYKSYYYLSLNLLFVFSLLGFFAFAVSLNFNKAFVVFHELLFSNDLWLMDPSKDLMIQMLPENFFSDMALNIGLGSSAMILALAIIGIGTHKWKRGERYGN